MKKEKKVTLWLKKETLNIFMDSRLWKQPQIRYLIALDNGTFDIV